MKYKAIKLETGRYAVGAGRNKYFPKTECDTFEEAEEYAYIYSYRWHWLKMDEMEDKFREKYGHELKESAC